MDLKFFENVMVQKVKNLLWRAFTKLEELKGKDDIRKWFMYHIETAQKALQNAQKCIIRGEFEEVCGWLLDVRMGLADAVREQTRSYKKIEGVIYLIQQAGLEIGEESPGISDEIETLSNGSVVSTWK